MRYNIMDLLKQPFMKLYNGVRGGISSLLTGTPYDINKMLEKHGDKRIVSFEPRRRPIPSAIDWVINKATGGRSDRGKEKLNYDHMFHLWSNITLEDGTKLMTQKNTRPYIKERHEKSGVASPYPTNINSGITLRELFKNAEKNVGSEALNRYDGRVHNCQHYTTSLLASSGMDTQRQRAWVNQNVKEVVSDDLGDKWYSRAGKLITDVGNIISRIFPSIEI